MWEYNYTDELYHYGVKGMKWGVRRGYNALSSYGVKTLNRKAEKYDYKAKQAAADGQRIQSAYYRYKRNKYKDRTFDDLESFYAGIADLTIKAESVVIAAKIGARYVKHVQKRVAKRRKRH